MTTIANNKENNSMVKALKKISQCKWVGNTRFESMDSCLASINLNTFKNSGWYNPVAVRIAGLIGWYMLNEDGSICPDFRVIKEQEKVFLIETLTTSGYSEFENLYVKLLDEE